MLTIADRRTPPVASDILEAARRLPAAVVADAAGDAARTVRGLAPVAPGRTGFGGLALTVEVAPGDNLALHKAIDLARPGEVLVVDAGAGAGRAVAGEVLGRYALARGVGALVIDGAVRDARALGELPLPVWCRAVSALRPHRVGPGRVGSPVTVGGTVVSSGDLVVGDDDGIVVVDARAIEEVHRRGPSILERDQRRAEAADRLELDRSWLEDVPTEFLL